MYWGRIIFLCLSLTTLGACDNKMQSLADDRLQDKVHACNMAVSQSPGFAISCDNFARECSRRSELGRYVC